MKISMPFSNWFLLGVFFIVALPLANPFPAFLHLPIWFFPVSWGKVLLFRILISSFALLSIYLILFNRQSLFSRIQIQTLLRTPLFLILSAFLGIFLLATIFSQDPSFSVWGDPNRSGGFLNLFFYSLFAFGAALLFKERDWHFIWKTAAWVGGAVSLIALFQWQGWFPDILSPTPQSRPSSTLGGPIFLAMYLLLLSFPTLSLALKESLLRKKVLYLSLTGLMFFVIMLTITRAAFIGIGLAAVVYILLYPYKKPLFKKLIISLATIGLISGGLLLFLFNTQQERFEDMYFIGELASRVSLEQALSDPRFSGWQVAWLALLEKPVVGYGPENFSIGFDQFYDSTLPRINLVSASWWDRAHNIFLDIGVQAGIGALILYAMLLSLLFWNLQSLKKTFPERAVFLLGLQAALAGYIVTNFFSFDVFSTFLLFFLILAYVLSMLLAKKNIPLPTLAAPTSWVLAWRIPLFVLSTIGIVWFIWTANLKPLHLNASISKASIVLSSSGCAMAINVMESQSKQDFGFLQSYYNIEYARRLSLCAMFIPERQIDFTAAAYQYAKQTAEIRPTFTRVWIGWGSGAARLIDYAQRGFLESFTTEHITVLKQEAEVAFTKAQSLSPRRQETYIEWVQSYLIQANYQKAKQKAQECIQLNPATGSCWWYLALAEIPLGEKEQAQKDIEKAARLGFNTHAIPALHQLTNAYLTLLDYAELKTITQQLIQKAPGEYQYYFALATAQRELGQYAQARETIQEMMRIFSSRSAESEAFLQTLP